MKKVYVYAYEKKNDDGTYRIVNMPGTNRPMLFPFSRKETFSKGNWMEESIFYRQLRKMSHNSAAPSSYSDNEKSGRTDAQARCSEIFEQSHHCPPDMPILAGDGTSLERLIIVELDLDNPQDVTPLALSSTERWKLQDWVAKKRDDFLRAQSEKKKVSEDTATAGLGLGAGIQLKNDSAKGSTVPRLETKEIVEHKATSKEKDTEVRSVSADISTGSASSAGNIGSASVGIAAKDDVISTRDAAQNAGVGAGASSLSSSLLSASITLASLQQEVVQEQPAIAITISLNAQTLPEPISASAGSTGAVAVQRPQ